LLPGMLKQMGAKWLDNSLKLNLGVKLMPSALN